MIITKKDYEDIIAIQFNDDIYFGKYAIEKAISIQYFTFLHPRSTFKFMAMLDLEPKWAEYATYPTIFNIADYRKFQKGNN